VINYAIALYANGEKLSNGAGSKVVNSTFNAMVERSNRSRPTTYYLYKSIGVTTHTLSWLHSRPEPFE